MRGVIYARYSAGPNQTDQSIEGQIRDCKMFAKANKISVVKVYSDHHISGKSTEGREEFLRMVRDAKDKQFECVIVWKIDRFGRNRADIAVYKKILKDAGVKLYYAKESIPEGAEGILLESLLEGLAEYYSADLSQKVSRGLRDTLLKGEYCFEAPFGYIKDENRHIQINKEYAPLIREAFEAYANGITMRSIKETLNDYGVRTSRGKELTNSAIERMLHNERYCGRCLIAGVKFDFPAIVSEELFEKCQRNVGKDNRNGSAKARVNYMLSMKCYCSECGALLTGMSAKGGKFNYYRCKTKGCTFNGVRKEKLEKTVLEATIDICLNDKGINEIVSAVMKYQEREIEVEPKKKLENKLKGIKRKISNVVNLMAETGSSALVEKLSELENEKAAVEAEIAIYDVSNNIISEDIIRNYLKLFQYQDYQSENVCKNLLQHFVNRVDVCADSAVITYNVSTANISSNRISLVDKSEFYLNKLYIKDGVPFIIIKLQ